MGNLLVLIKVGLSNKTDLADLKCDYVFYSILRILAGYITVQVDFLFSQLFFQQILY